MGLKKEFMMSAKVMLMMFLSLGSVGALADNECNLKEATKKAQAELTKGLKELKVQIKTVKSTTMDETAGRQQYSSYAYAEGKKPDQFGKLQDYSQIWFVVLDASCELKSALSEGVETISLTNKKEVAAKCDLQSAASEAYIELAKGLKELKVSVKGVKATTLDFTIDGSVYLAYAYVEGKKPGPEFGEPTDYSHVWIIELNDSCELTSSISHQVQTVRLAP